MTYTDVLGTTGIDFVKESSLGQVCSFGQTLPKKKKENVSPRSKKKKRQVEEKDEELERRV